MSDSDPEEKNTTPSWQKQIPEDTKETRIAQAKRFLEEDHVHNASTAKKTSFLESKGYLPEEIKGLLDTEAEKNSEASQESSPKSDQNLTIHDSTDRNTTNTSQNQQNIISAPGQSQEPADTPPMSFHSSPPQTAYTSQEAQPPIITYPEFLTKPTAPSPLITSSRLLTTLTLFSSVSMLLYGTNKYLLTPMQESLTQSRHELFTRASDHLLTLNEKLGEAVSEQPDSVSPYKDIEDDESDGDPTEMFHRDIGVQTSPSLLDSRTPSPSHDSSTPPKSPLESQLGRLAVITSHLNEINETSTSEGSDAAELTTTIDVLRDYLESMAFTPPTYTFGGTGYSGLVRDMVGGSGSKEEPDEIAKLKASIRSVKGVLLSARSFPSGGRGVGSGMGATSVR